MTVNYLNMVQGGGKIPRRRFEKRRGTQLHDLVTLADRKELVPLGSQTGKISVAGKRWHDPIIVRSWIGGEGQHFAIRGPRRPLSNSDRAPGDYRN